MNMRTAILLMVLATLASCAIQTQPKPELAVPAVWRTPMEGVASAGNSWWLSFNDTELTKLIETAQLQNLDVAAAGQRVAQAQASLAAARGQQLPSVDLGASARETDGKSSASVNLGAAYTLDLWGAARARAFGARSQLEATEASRSFTVWRLGAAAAQLYYRRRALDERLKLADGSLAIAERTYGLVESRYKAGFISGLDLALAQTAVANQRSSVASVQLERDQAHNAMAQLLGQAPAQLAESVPNPQALLDLTPPPIPQALPAEALARRPDIHVLEAQLRGADANITVARAELFPQIGISADGSFVRGAEEMVFSIGASLVQAVFDGGQRRAGVRLAQAQYAELLENYRAGILAALVEIEDVLAQVRRLADREESDRAVLESAQRAYQLSEIRYKSGLVDAFVLLSSQDSFLRARDSLIQTRSSRLQALVGLQAGIAGLPE